MKKRAPELTLMERKSSGAGAEAMFMKRAGAMPFYDSCATMVTCDIL